jgi:transcription termination/antitermination protein NusG
MTDTQTASEKTAAANPRHKWYIVHAYSNFEKKVAEAIRDQARQQGIEDQFSEILVPTEDVVEIRRGRKFNSERKFFPGYVLVKMELSDEAYVLVKNTPKVTGFLGSPSKPAPVSEREVARIIGAIEEGVERPKPTIQFDIGETVRVTDGPFQSFSGVVEQVDEDRARLRVTVSIFGRATPVELEYGQVEKGAG